MFFCMDTNAQEDAYYNALDQFLENPTQSNFEFLINSSDRLTTPNRESTLAKVIVDCNIAYHFERQGQLHAAINRYEEAITNYTQNNLQDYDIVTYAMIPLGNLYTKTNAYQEAEQMIKGYITLSRKQNNIQNLLSGLTNLSVPLQNQGKFQQAIAILEEARSRDPKNANILINLATNYMSLGKYNVARDITSLVLKIDASQVNAYKLLAQIALLEKDKKRAIAQLKVALRIQQKQINTPLRELAKTRIILAQTYLTNEDYEDALQELDTVYLQWIPSKTSRTLPAKEDLIADNTLLDALDLQAQIHYQQGNLEKALQAFHLAAHVSDLLNQPQLTQQSRLVLEASDKKRSESRLGLLYTLYQASSDLSLLEEAITISDRSKSSLLSEANKDQDFLNRYAQDSLVIAFRQQQENTTQLEKLLTNYSASGQMELLEKTQQTYASQLLAKKKSRQLLAKKYPQLNLENNSIDLKTLREKARATNHTVVSYFFGFTSIYQFIIGPEELEFNQLANDRELRDKFFNQCASYTDYFTNASTILNDPHSFSKQALELYQNFNLPQSPELVVIPDGVLSFVPINTLLTKETPSTVFEKMPFLVKETRVSWQLSLREYLKPSTSIEKNSKVLGVFPVFENTKLALTHSLDEAAGIEDTFSCTILLKQEATLGNAFAKAYQYPILHFSTHAVGGSFSSPASIQFRDGSLSLNELYSKNLQPDLVVLSACETGVGRIATGEGTMHLARGFQYAGAKSVLFSLWKVNDKATAQLMKQYYMTLEETNSRDLSLQTAQLTYINDPNTSNVKKSPYYWGAFVYYGPTDIATQATTTLWWWILAIFGVFLLLILITKYGKS